ncbi:unnamed protein product [Absidia cylindrospora]
MDSRRRSRFHLQKEATLGYCLKDVDDFASDIHDRHWMCPFCKNFNFQLPKDEDHSAWIKCAGIINSHLSAHRSALLQKASTEDLVQYEKNKGSNHARIWVSGTMKDRGYH